MNTEISNYRSLFPHTGNLVYMNHASVSPLSSRVTKAIQDFLVRRSVTEVDVYPGFTESVQKARQVLGNLIHASARDIAFQTNTSEGLNLLANGIKWKRGDRIILFSRDFPAVTQTFAKLIKEGVHLDMIREREGHIETDDILRAMKPTTQLVCLSHVQFLNGFRLNLEEIGRLCNERGIIFAVDAIQSAGVIPIDVKKMKIDFLSCGGQKWLMGPMGTGFVFVSEELRTMLNQAYVGWLSVESPWTFFDLNQRLAKDARRYEPGTLNAMGIVGLTESVSLLLEIGVKNIEKQVTSLNQYLLKGMAAYGVRPAFAYEDNDLSGIVSFIISEPDLIAAKLKEQNIIVSAREKYLRISPHFYNTTDEMDHLLKTLKEIDYKIKYEKSKAFFPFPLKQEPKV
ncbi:MAG: aminotransferase class V-fold PLP-dependent enzyme [Bacteroidetes bacterium]|nr:aminotransferase class V-fold PLP-dependent enzyme [Bacteroidota bacterium]